MARTLNLSTVRIVIIPIHLILQLFMPKPLKIHNRNISELNNDCEINGNSQLDEQLKVKLAIKERIQKYIALNSSCRAK